MSEFHPAPQPTHRRRAAAYAQPEAPQPVEQPMAVNNRMIAPARPAAPQPVQVHTGGNRNSFFDGGLLQEMGNNILCFLITALTLGICYPWALCRKHRWRIRHTVIEGRRLDFDGRAAQLVGKWILWLLLSIVTCGIYGFWVHIALEKWKVKHTHFADAEE